MSLNSSDSGIFTLREFYNRGVIKMAPDVLVYIGGSLTTMVVAPVSGQDSSLNFNDGITSVSVQNNVDPPGSSNASIEINTPIYGEKSKYWVNYKGIDESSPVRAPVFVPMMEVKIFFKGRYFVNDQPQYYPAFWGFITNVEEQYNGGLFKINLNCADMLHWWSYSSINVHPSVEANDMVGGGQTLKLSVWASVFEKANPYQIMYALTQDMGMHEFITPVWAAQLSSINEIYPRDLLEAATSGIMQYWKQRFANIGGLLKMFGINGRRVNQNGVQQRVPEDKVPKKFSESKVMEATTGRDDIRYSIDPDFIRSFAAFADFNKMGQFESSEYMTKLEIATTLKSRINFEFYQDVNGNWIFKPPFYNLNVKGMQPYSILANEIISNSFSIDSEGIVTVMTVFTPFDRLIKESSYGRGVGFHMDIDLIKRYGVRSQEKMVEYVRERGFAKTLAISLLSQTNAKTVTGNITIPGRPEMKLGYPVYVEHRDSFHYIKSINHSFDYGGSFTTTLSLETERRKKFGNKNELLKDKVFRFNNEIPEDLTKKVNPEDPPYLYTTENSLKTEELLLKGENRLFSNTQGRYKLDNRTSETTNRVRSIQELSITTTTVPYTDEDGYQLVSGFPYGRNLNAINVLSDKSDLPVLKEVYLTTMARPLYTSESRNMEILFFPGEEGAVPSYLNTSTPPVFLGKEEEVDELNKTEILGTLTDSQKTKSYSSTLYSGLASGENVKIVKMTPENAKINAPLPNGSPILVNNVG